MAGVDEQLYEAARVDGAGWWTRFWHVTLPSIRFNIEFCLSCRLLKMSRGPFRSFIPLAGGPGYSTHTLEYSLYLGFYERENRVRQRLVGDSLLYLRDHCGAANQTNEVERWIKV